MLIQVDRTNSKTLTQQVYEKIRYFILNGDLTENEKLPSTRELSASIGVSRNTILEVYDQLVAEGYLIVRPKSGTFVAPGSLLNIQEKSIVPSIDKKVNPEHQDIIDFKAATPAMDHFPRKIWGKLAKEVCEDTPETAFGYHQADGVPELKEELAKYLLRTRGVICHPNQIMITSGATQGLSLISKMLLKTNHFVAVEDPLTYEMRNIFSNHGATLLPIPVDEKGMNPDYLMNDAPPSFIFVLPSHQFPLGVTLTIQRRIQLIEYARNVGCYIVEDDYDSEFTYEGTPVHSMQGLDQERVIYVGTFSKILSPSLRIGYVVLPNSLIEEFKTLKWNTDRHSPTLEQLVLTRFMKDGYFDRHIRKMKRIYKQRREALVLNLKKHFPDCTIVGHATGMHLVVEFSNVEFDESLIKYLESKFVRIYPVRLYSLSKDTHANKIVLGYGSLTGEKIEDGVRKLKTAIETYSLNHPPH